MKRKDFGYALFVVIAVIILASLPLLVGKIDPIHILLVLTTIGFLWTILRIYMKKSCS